jgi:hypothetical protein
MLSGTDKPALMNLKNNDLLLEIISMILVAKGAKI